MKESIRLFYCFHLSTSPIYGHSDIINPPTGSLSGRSPRTFSPHLRRFPAPAIAAANFSLQQHSRQPPRILCTPSNTPNRPSCLSSLAPAASVSPTSITLASTKLTATREPRIVVRHIEPASIDPGPSRQLTPSKTASATSRKNSAMQSTSSPSCTYYPLLCTTPNLTSSTRV
jgi:hypothetical protein